jgi:hypothetical protein
LNLFSEVARHYFVRIDAHMNETISEIQRLLQEIPDHLKSGHEDGYAEGRGKARADRRAGLNLGFHDPGTTVALFDRIFATDNYGNTASPWPAEPAMSLEMERRHLEQANRHIAEGWERIAAQKARVALMERGGHDTGLARDLLRHFERALEHMLEHRELILRAIDRLQH